MYTRKKKKINASSNTLFVLFWCFRLPTWRIIRNFWEPMQQTYGSIMHARAMQVKTCQCLNPRRRPSATIRIESACGVATDWVTCGFLNPNEINNVFGAWRLMYSREVKIYRLVIAKRKNEQPTSQRVRWKCNCYLRYIFAQGSNSLRRRSAPYSWEGTLV